jgi:NAD(P)H dehydrogenase (quinone)
LEPIMTVGVSGASGKLGRAVAEHLLDTADPGQVVLVTRDPANLADLAERGADVREGDYHRPETLTSAYAGVDRLLLIPTAELFKRVPGQLAAVQAAAEAGVKHIVYASVQNPSDDNPAIVVPDHRQTEDGIRASGLTWTMLRNGIYADLHLGSVVPAAASGRIVSNSGSGRNGYVTRADCAAVAAAVLVGEGHENKIYDITGPEALDPHDVAAAYSEVTGKPIDALVVDDETWITMMIAEGMPEAAAQAYVTLGAGQRAGYAGVVTTTVERLTGKPPTSFRDFLKAHAAEFAQA